MKRRVIVVALVIVFLVISVSVGYYYVYEQPNSINSTTPVVATSLTTPANSVSTAITTSNSTVKIMFAGVVLTVELATTPEEQQRGLSGRVSMPADHGMLFVFNQQSQWGFWMIDMHFPLDIIWFSANKQAVFIEQDLPPCTPQACPVFTSPVNALYVLEVNAGFVKTYGVSIGESFTFV